MTSCSIDRNTTVSLETSEVWQLWRPRNWSLWFGSPCRSYSSSFQPANLWGKMIWFVVCVLIYTTWSKLLQSNLPICLYCNVCLDIYIYMYIYIYICIHINKSYIYIQDIWNVNFTDSFAYLLVQKQSIACHGDQLEAGRLHFRVITQRRAVTQQHCCFNQPKKCNNQQKRWVLTKNFFVVSFATKKI